MMDRSPLEVLVAGGGVAATELVLALHELAGPRVHVTLLAPNDELDIRALRTLASFTGAAPPRLPLRPIAVRARARLERATLRRVLPDQHLAELADGRRLPYDALVLAVGATPVSAYCHSVATFGLESESAGVSGALQDLETGRARSAAFVVPPGVAWTLPLYELALLTAQRLSGKDARLVLVTPESAPLAIFGPEAARAAGDLLKAAGIAVHLGAYASVDAPCHIALRPSNDVLSVDRVIALPRQIGHAPGGVPCDADGFVAVDDAGHVLETDDLFAIGDVTSFPVKQGGLACQQADVVAEQLAARAGADLVPRTFRPVLRGQLLAGSRTLHLSSPIAGGAGPDVAHARTIWRPSHKVDALYLSRLLEDDPAFAIPPVGVDVTISLPSPSDLERNPLALDPYSPSRTP
jgi:sulfide:quinone oxidoreductase